MRKLYVIWGIVLILLGLAFFAFGVKTRDDIGIIPVHHPIIRDTVWTAYTASEDETDSEPRIMASGEEVYNGAIACPDYLPFGAQVEVLLTGYIFTCSDRMNIRYRKLDHFDMYVESKELAYEFGKAVLDIKVIPRKLDVK